MSVLRNATERGSEQEMNLVGELAQLFAGSRLSLEEKIVNPGLFMRRQELSYLIADYEIFRLIQPIKGSIFYFGVYHGAGFMTYANLSAALEPFNHTREIIGFDTFTGNAGISNRDTTHGKSFRTLVEGGFAGESKDFVEKLTVLYDRNRPLSHIARTKLIEGDVVETLPRYLERNQHTVVSLIVLTMNLYEPTKTALSLLWPRLPKGGVVVAYSLNEEYYPGATMALMEVLGGSFSETLNTLPFAPNMAYFVKGGAGR